MGNRRLLLHIGFWAFYLLLNGYVEVAMVNYSYFDLPIGQRIYKGFSVQGLILLPVIAVTYFIMYYSFPKHLGKKAYGRLLVECLLALIFALVVYRGILIYIIYPYIYHEAYEHRSFIASFPRHVWTFLDIISIVAIAVSIKLARLRLSGLEKEKQLIEEKLASELNFLRAQTNPHFLFNTLNNIYALARKKSDKTAEVVMGLSKILRFILYECVSARISLSREVKIIHDYIALEQLRYDERLSVEVNIDIDDESIQIAPLLLLPLVENAFKHGISEARFDAMVLIHLRLLNGQLFFNIRNTKEPDSAEITKGIGLTNISRQLELIYPNKHSLEILTQNDIFEVKLNIDLTDDKFTA